jgi:hypothetical protein
VNDGGGFEKLEKKAAQKKKFKVAICCDGKKGLKNGLQFRKALR